MLPNFAHLDLARTDTLAPGEAADLEAQFLKTPDFFLSVLEQVENISDPKAACQVVSTWCSADTGRARACKTPMATPAWKALIEKCFGKYAPVPSETVAASPLVNVWQRHFYDLCKMDPVDRLVRAGVQAYAAVSAAVRAEIDEEYPVDEFPDTHPALLMDLPSDVLRKLARAAKLDVRHDYYVAPLEDWTTGIDEKANVALAIIKLANWLSLDDDVSVHTSVMDAMVTLQHEIEQANDQATADQSMQMAELTRWLFVQHPRFTLAQEKLAPYMGDITDILWRVFVWTVPLAKQGALTGRDETLVTTVLDAFVAIANYRDQAQRYDWSDYATPSISDRRLDGRFNVAGDLSVFLRHGNAAQKKRTCDLIYNSLRMSVQKRSLGLPDTERKVAFTRNLISYGLLNDLEYVGIDDYDLSRRSMGALGAITRQLAQLRTTTRR